MKPIVAGVLASIAAVGLLSACGDDPIASLPTNNSTPTEVTFPAGVSIPTDLTIPTDLSVAAAGSIPDDFTVPQAAIDQMIAQFEAAGMTVDRECFNDLLSDKSLRNLVTDDGTPTADGMQKFFACLKA